MILIHQVLTLLGLEVEFAGELGILNHGQLCGAHELILVHVQHLNLHCPDLQQHLLPKIVDLDDLVLVDLLLGLLVVLNELLQLVLQSLQFVVPFILRHHELLHLSQLVVNRLVSFLARNYLWYVLIVNLLLLLLCTRHTR